MVKVVWTELAIEDLKSIHEYISRDSKAYANKFVEKIIERVDQLEMLPKSGRVVPEFGSEIIRELIEGHYRIVYRIHPQLHRDSSGSSFSEAIIGGNLILID